MSEYKICGELYKSCELAKKIEELQAENKNLKEIINYAIDGVDALNHVADKTPTYEDFEAIKETLKQALKGE